MPHPCSREHLDPLSPCTWPVTVPRMETVPQSMSASTFAGLADDEGVVRDDLPLDAAVHPEGVAEAQLAENLGARVHEPVEILGTRPLILITCLRRS